MAAVFPSNIRRKKKLSPEKDSGMSMETKRHFEHVKHKMFAFLDRRHRSEADGNRLTPPVSFHPGSQRLLVDQNKAVQPQLQHHRTPAPSHKHLHTPLVAHRQLPHLALATPQVARRRGI